MKENKNEMKKVRTTLALRLQLRHGLQLSESDSNYQTLTPTLKHRLSDRPTLTLWLQLWLSSPTPLTPTLISTLSLRTWHQLWLRLSHSNSLTLTLQSDTDPPTLIFWLIHCDFWLALRLLQLSDPDSQTLTLRLSAFECIWIWLWFWLWLSNSDSLILTQTCTLTLTCFLLHYKILILWMTGNSKLTTILCICKV